MSFSLNEILNDNEWDSSVKKYQRPSGKPLRTSQSEDEDIRLGVTTFNISDYMQGAALYAPTSLAYDLSNKSISQELSKLLANDTKSAIGPGVMSLIPMDILLNAQQAAMTTTGPLGQTGTPPSSGGSLNPPEELKKYGNGKIPAEALVPVGIGSHRLWEKAAIAFKAMRAAAKNEGVDLNITDSYRSYELQVETKRKKGNLAATPGTSNHGWGLALDMKWEDGSGSNINSKGFKWMTANASKYGWIHPTWAKRIVEGRMWEPWHWEYRRA